MEPINPPENSEQRNIIDKLAEFVARNGPHFEMMTKSKQANNPKFNFLFGGEHYQYYQWRLEVERNSVKNDAFGPNGPPPPMPPQNMNPGQFFPGLPPPPQSLGPHPPPPFGRPPVPMLNQLPKHLHGEPPFPQPPHHPAHPFPPSSMPQPPTLSLPPPMFQQAPPPPPFSAAPNMPPSAQPPFNNWHFQPQPQPAAAPGAQIDQPVESNAPPALDSAVLEQIAKAREAIAESQKNLDAQCKVLLEEDKQARIDEMINKALDDELKRMCEDYNINLNEFDKILQPIIETCRKESIANGKSWIFNNCSTAEQYDAVSKHILKKVTRTECSFEAKLHLMYLINDLYNRCMRKCSDQLRDSINSIIVPAFTTTLLEADEEKKQKMNKLLKLWEMNQYLDNSLLDQLKSPRQSLDAYKTSLYTRFDEQIQAITNEQTAKYSQMSKQHSDFVKHQEAIIQQLQQTKQPAYSSTNGPPQMAVRPPFPPATSNSNVYLGPGPPGPMPGRPLLPPNHGLHPFPHNQPTPPQIPPGYPSPYSHQPGPGLPPHNFYSNPNVPTSGAPPFLPPISGGPHLAPMPPLGVLPGGPGAPHLSPHAQEGPPVEEVRPPYFDMPAGIMTQYIKLEDFDYKPINPNEVRIPPFAPPTDRLLKAIEAFYAPPSHEHPRNAEGWEKLGLYEFIKAKSKARQEYEERKAAENDGEDDEDDVIATQTSNGVSDKDNANKKNNRSPSPPKKRYKVFKEERDPSSSKPSTTNSNTNSNSSSSGKSGRRSRSASPRKERRNRSKRSRSKSRSRSHSRSKSPRTRSHRGRRSRSPVARSKQRSRTKSPPPPISFQPFGRFTATANPQIPLGESNKGHQLLKKMGWSGAGGLGANEHGIQNPISAGEVRDRQDQYRGIGTSLGASDPFESYRRNKGQAYIQRIKDARQ